MASRGEPLFVILADDTKSKFYDLMVLTKAKSKRELVTNLVETMYKQFVHKIRVGGSQ